MGCQNDVSFFIEYVDKTTDNSSDKRYRMSSTSRKGVFSYFEPRSQNEIKTLFRTNSSRGLSHLS